MTVYELWIWNKNEKANWQMWQEYNTCVEAIEASSYWNDRDYAIDIREHNI